MLSGAGTVTSSAAPTRDIMVQLFSGDLTEVTVPATVILHAGQTSANFDLTIVDDTVIDGTQTASVTAHVENWTEGSANIDILDNDRFLAVLIPVECLGRPSNYRHRVYWRDAGIRLSGLAGL